MNRIQLACFSLLVSAILLTGMLIVRLGDRMHADDGASPQTALTGLLEQKAHGEMVITGEGFTLMTAQTRPDEEALFLLHNDTGRLLIYTTDVSNNQIELVGGANMREVFGRR